MIKAVLFDLDGTLINSEEYYMKGMVFLANSLGANVDTNVFFNCIGKDMDETYALFESVVRRPKNEWLDIYNDYFISVNPLNFKSLLFDDVINVFSKLKERNIKIIICSMSPSDYVNSFINECNLSNYIDGYISGDMCKNNKPNPEIYLKALSIFNLNKDETIVVEDAKTGIEAANNAGLKVIARDASRFNIDQSGALYIFKDLAELFKII